jgi:putative endonuclease
MVEHSAVNRRVAGSSPARGAKDPRRGFFICTSLEHSAVYPDFVGMQVRVLLPKWQRIQNILFIKLGGVQMIYYLYILKSKVADKFYTGISQKPELRHQYHNTVEKGFTSRYRPWEIIYIKEYPDKKSATGAEKKIKSWKSRKMIEKILSGEQSI